MNINRHNYESFFMLYIDKELSGEEKQAVDAFIDNNADLKVELEQLLLAVLPIEELSFENKAQLLKNEIFTEADEINLMLLLDGELNAAETKILEGKINSLPAFAAAWAILKKTKLNVADDAVGFTNKELLYRKEEKVRPLYFMLRWAAAAAVIGIGFYAGIKMLNKEENSLSPEKATATIEKGTTNISGSNNNYLNKIDVTDKPLSANSSVLNQKTQVIVKNKTATIKATPEINKIGNYKKSNIENNKNQPENAPILLASNSDNVKIKTYETAAVKPELTSKLPAKRPEIIDINILETQQDKNALLTAFKGNNDGDRILYMDKEVVEKTKVGKFLKKVKNSLSGDIEIKSEKTLKIAGFEFALK